MRKGSHRGHRCPNTISTVLQYSVEPRADGCWIWTSKISKQNGYGHVTVNYKSILAHRFIYEQLKGPIPEGYQIDHLCKDRACVNPDHLEAVTPRENLRRSPNVTTLNAAKVVCLRGHPLSGDNLYVPPGRPGRRYCKTCMRENSMRFAKRK